MLSAQHSCAGYSIDSDKLGWWVELRSAQILAANAAMRWGPPLPMGRRSERDGLRGEWHSDSPRVREVPRCSIRKSSGFVNAPYCPFMGLGLFGNFTICGIFRVPHAGRIASLINYRIIL